MRRRSGAVLEAPALVPGLNDVTVMGEAIEQRRGHLGIAESFMMPPFWNASCVGRAREGGRFVRGKDRFATVAPWRVDGRQGVRERDNGRSYVEGQSVPIAHRSEANEPRLA